MDKKGNMVIIALCITLITGIMIAAFYPLVTNGLNQSVGNRDDVAAQYAAEAGAKRAVAMFYQSSQDWSWLDTDESTPTWHMLNDNENERYHVKVSLSKDGDLIALDAPAVANVYYVTSTGEVNDATKMVSAKVTVESGDDEGSGSSSFDSSDPNSLEYYVIYSKTGITIDGASCINGIVAAKPEDSINTHGRINGNNEFIEGVDLNFPSFDSLLSNTDQPGETLVNIDHSSSLYQSINSKYIISSDISNENYIFTTEDDVYIQQNVSLSNATINSKGNIIIDNNVSLNNITLISDADIDMGGQNINPNNCIIFARGIITTRNSGGQNFNGCLVVSNSDITNHASFGTSVIICYGEFTSIGGENFNSGAVWVVGQATFKGRGNYTYSSTVVDGFFPGTDEQEDNNNITVSTWESV